MAGNAICLARELRDPPGVVDVGGVQFEPDGTSRRHDEFVRGDDAVVGIAVLPPPLVADHHDLEGVLRRRGAFDIADEAHRGERQHEDDDDRDHRPRELDGIAAVDLTRLALAVARGLRGAILEDRVHERALHDDEDRGADRKQQPAERLDVRRRRARRIEHRRDRRHRQPGARIADLRDRVGCQPRRRRCGKPRGEQEDRGRVHDGKGAAEVPHASRLAGIVKVGVVRPFDSPASHATPIQGEKVPVRANTATVGGSFRSRCRATRL